MTIKLANNVSGFLNTAITASDTGIVLQSGNGASFPALGAGEYFYATLVSTGNTLEVVKVTARSGDSMTVVRAQDGTSAASFAAGSRLEMRINAQAVLDVVDQVTASQVGFTPVGGIAATDVQAALAEVDSEKVAFTRLDDSDGSSLVGFLQAGLGAVATNVQTKLRETVSVKDFGAVGDGVTDDTAAIQAAVDYSTSLQGRITIQGAGICLVAGTVNFTHGENRRPIYFTGGAYKKTNSGSMFSASVDNSGDVYFDNVHFESVVGAGTIIFDTDYIIRLHTTNCHFRSVDTVWYSGNDPGAPFQYSQSCRSIGDTVAGGGTGYAFDLAAAFDCVWDNLTLEQRNSGIRVRSSGQGAHSFRVVNSVLERLSGTAIRIESTGIAVQIENNYFELNVGGHISFGSAAVASAVTIKGNLFAGADNPATNGTAAIIWPANCQNAKSFGNNSLFLQLHDVSATTSSSVFSQQDKNGAGKTFDRTKICALNNLASSTTTVAGKAVNTSFFGTFDRLTLQETVSVPDAATTTFTADFGVVMRTDDFVSIQCNTAADILLAKYRKVGNTIEYTLRNNTGSSQSVQVTVCVLKPYFSLIG